MMNKALLLAMLALSSAVIALPTASACYSTNEVIRYVICDGGGSRRDVQAALAFVGEEAGDAIEFVQSTEAWGLLP